AGGPAVLDTIRWASPWKPPAASSAETESLRGGTPFSRFKSLACAGAQPYPGARSELLGLLPARLGRPPREGGHDDLAGPPAPGERGFLEESGAQGARRPAASDALLSPNSLSFMPFQPLMQKAGTPGEASGETTSAPEGGVAVPA